MRRIPLRVSVSALAFPLLLAGCLGGSGDVGTSSPADVRYAFVAMGPNGQAIARAITVAATCPAITFDNGGPAPMQVRAAAASVAPRPTAYEPHNTAPADFPVTVCDAAIPAGVARAAIGDRVLPLPRRHVQKVLLIADTGCRMKSTANLYQACNDAVDWPFRPLAEVAALQAPDLVIHIGDYHYRETSCPVGSACATITSFGFGWASWEPDFFAPAQPLFKAAPWIFVRGDHETCDRGGQGWWRMLDPRPLAPAQDCNLAANDAVGNYSEPYAVPIDDDVALVVYDSAAVPDKLKPDEPAYSTYLGQARSAFQLAAGWPHAFFMNHQPILGYNSDETPVAQPGNEALQSVLGQLVPQVLFPASIDAVLSGHVHMLQVVGYATAQPPIFIPGNGGTQLVPTFTDFSKARVPLPGAVVATFLQSSQFGFMTLERSGAGWTAKAFDRNGTVLTTCALASRKADCTPLA